MDKFQANSKNFSIDYILNAAPAPQVADLARVGQCPQDLLDRLSQQAAPTDSPSPIMPFSANQVTQSSPLLPIFMAYYLQQLQAQQNQRRLEEHLQQHSHLEQRRRQNAQIAQQVAAVAAACNQRQSERNTADVLLQNHLDHQRAIRNERQHQQHQSRSESDAPVVPQPPISAPHHPMITPNSGQTQNAHCVVATQLNNMKPAHSYIGLIGMCILSNPEKKMVLSDIYQHILDNYPYYRNRGSGWRNSVRHNLSLNECFQKAGRAANGKGHYWTIHPANMDDFMAGDFRRRRAQNKVRKWNNLDVPSDEEDIEAEDPAKPPLPDHFKRSLEMHRQLEAFQKSILVVSSNVSSQQLRQSTPAGCSEVGPNQQNPFKFELP